ncbi:MAG TPA: hypothetical protein VGF36_11490 [Rhodopila sp.]
MSDSVDKANDMTPDTVKPHNEHDDHLEDQEKILAGKHDVNYPAVLTRDVPGG